MKKPLPSAAAPDHSISITNCHFQDLGAGKMAALEALAEAARANAEAIKEIAAGMSRSDIIGMQITQAAAEKPTPT